MDCRPVPFHLDSFPLQPFISTSARRAILMYIPYSAWRKYAARGSESTSTLRESNDIQNYLTSASILKRKDEMGLSEKCHTWYEGLDSHSRWSWRHELYVQSMNFSAMCHDKYSRTNVKVLTLTKARSTPMRFRFENAYISMRLGLPFSSKMSRFENVLESGSKRNANILY